MPIAKVDPSARSAAVCPSRPPDHRTSAFEPSFIKENPMRSVRSMVAVSCLLALACGDDPPKPAALPYSPNETNVIGGDGFFNAPTDGGASGGGGIAVGTPNGDECINLDDVCVRPQVTCDSDEAAADVLVDKDGTVLYTACYPTSGVSVESFEGPVGDLPNNAVLVIDDADDGVDVMGDVTIDGNNVTVYGNGPDSSVIGGNLNIAMNNSIVRGVRIQGDAVISKNGGTLIDCVIEGNLTITGENVNVALCEIWGETTITANNAVLVQNVFAKQPTIDAKVKACNDDLLFADANQDGVVDPDEIQGEISCDITAKPGKP
jgi:hypothetical protein